MLVKAAPGPADTVDRPVDGGITRGVPVDPPVAKKTSRGMRAEAHRLEPAAAADLRGDRRRCGRRRCALFSIPAYLLPGPGAVFARVVSDAPMLWTTRW